MRHKVTNDKDVTKRTRSAEAAVGRQERFLHSLCACLFLKLLNEEIVGDEILQAIVLSAYVAKADKIQTEPFEVFCALSDILEPILPDALPTLSSKNSFRGAFRFRVTQCLRAGRGHPSTLTVALACLYRALGIPVRLVIGVEDDVGSRGLAYSERRELLCAQLGQGSLRLSRARPPIIWLEVYWPEVSSWVGVQLYDKLFHFHQLLGKPKHLKLGEINALYLKKFAARIIPRLQRTHLALTQVGGQQQELQSSGFTALLLASSDSDESPTESIATPTIVTPSVSVDGKPDEKLQAEMEEESLLANLSMTETQRMESNPFKLFGASSQIGPRSHFHKKTVLVFALTKYSEFKSVTPRYFTGIRSARQKLFRSLQSPVISLFGDLIKSDLTNKAPQERHLEALDEAQLAKCRLSEPMPRSLAGFSNHPVYALESQMKTTEWLREGSKPVGCFKGENVFSRLDVLPLASVDEWARKGRQVPLSTKPIKTINKKKNDVNIPVSLFSSDQTIPLSEEAYQAYITASGKCTVVKNAKLPNGFIHLRETLFPGVTKAARSLDVQFNIAITDFTFTGGKIQSIKDGVVLRLEDEESVMDRQRGIERRMLREALYERRERASQWWRVCLKMVAAMGAAEAE